jgi:predicted DNA-binding transcriptional regulator YafY
VAYDGDRANWRTFRIDRMEGPVPARNRFEPRKPPAKDLHEYVRRNLRDLVSPIRIVIEVEVAGSEVRAAFGTWVDVENLASGRCRVTMDADSFRWPTHIVTSLHAPFRVVTPPDFEQHLNSIARS